MKKCAYLTMRDPGDFVTDYDLSFAAMAAHGWHVATVCWRDASLDWNRFDAVYICTPWDYPQHLQQFLEVLQSIENSTAVLVNPLALVHWTLEKTYLADLQHRGADIVPSRWFDDFAEQEIADCFQAFDVTTLIIKPVVGANAQDTYVLQQPIPPRMLAMLRSTFLQRAFFVQPFIDNIRTEGEFSLFYFGGAYSHAILKVPKVGDFRVQEEHGGDIRSVQPSAALLAAGQHVLSLVEPQPVYVRADFVRSADNRFLLMELEMIEPSLYLRMDADAADRFAAAFDHYVSGEIS
ncbi:MAG: hypothetical protein OEW64_11045 [Gammaproteobacteria bacterium]|nr:hypothetical protein [Gammaproteobacteria bacterium]MDH5304615.1 hypothetical protein [Gammaproteobacteria bacterium]MDH5322083.1 hypothetical protein [Gammaproteobacteria bacterium]